MLRVIDQSHKFFARLQKLIKRKCVAKVGDHYYLNRKYQLYAFYAGRHNNTTSQRHFLGFPATKAAIFRKPQTAERLHANTCNEVHNFPFETRCVRSSRCNYTSTEDPPYQNNQRGLIWQNSFGIHQPTTQMYVHVATAGSMYVVE